MHCAHLCCVTDFSVSSAVSVPEDVLGFGWCHLSLGHLWPLCSALGWVGTLSCAPKSEGVIAFALGHFLDEIHVQIKALLLKLCCFYKSLASSLIYSLKYSFYLLRIAEGVWTPPANWIWFAFPSKRSDHGQWHGNYSCSGDGVLLIFLTSKTSAGPRGGFSYPWDHSVWILPAQDILFGGINILFIQEIDY